MNAVEEYSQGTQRTYNPEETLRRIAPAMRTCGISRVLDVTHLDRIGIPTYNAVRPNGMILSVSNGKGWTKAAASVSAIMESIEVEHAEYPDTSAWHLAQSAKVLRNRGYSVVDAPTLISECLWPSDTYGGLYYSDDLRLDWVEGREIIESRPVLLPASTIYVRAPYVHYFTSNGLASGNTWEEATLHGICELIERDSTARLLGRPEGMTTSRLLRIEPKSMPEHLGHFSEKVAQAGIELFMFALPSAIDIHTFWAVFHCPGEPSFMLATSAGFGCHTSPQIAASRALTEAAQSRLTYIHGAREDLGIDHVNRQLTCAETEARLALQARTFAKFRQIPTVTWDELLAVAPHRARGRTIPESLSMVLRMLKEAGHGQVYVHDLTKRGLDLAVTKAFVPGLKVSAKMI
ncbi:hypothetical protein CN204_18465 [Sinorhizobium meliloti]|uniref:YcaO-like family protein n=1 Tax=Sinorhizobium kummerowiae TaxID=158892 RepID=A0ABY8TJL1_9HYPH|nr:MULTISPECIES: YcaO-like family protein [Sinorhizobium]ARS67239.1 hypothetical protein SMRU11_08620 [Sinorhizobium meliloti RU11/001]MBP2470699.1 ribosomal protein S12 methylthiotransferase accessory factor [Sinorhizobium meliloti]MDE3763909.1 YcaO-like family protein [Sinorhizobium meliloti]MDE3776271.1 YcaO-like family protein [Sinorhizobium meliloti]MDE3792830.1 YcaO-like family protein [Sinorhizobium meliloti]